MQRKESYPAVLQSDGWVKNVCAVGNLDYEISMQAPGRLCRCTAMLSRLRSILAHLNQSSRAKMSTAVHNTNEACCTIPPVLSEYEAKGTIKPYAGFQKVYITGPSTSENAIVAIFDIFGWASCCYPKRCFNCCLASFPRPSRVLTSWLPL